MGKYYDTFERDRDYMLSDGTILRHGHDPKNGRAWFRSTDTSGKTRALDSPEHFLAVLNADVAQSLMPAFAKARTPEEIIEVSQVISSTRGRTSGPEVRDIFRTPDGRKYQVTYYAGQRTEWGYIE